MDFKIVRIFVICLVTLPFQPVVLQFIFSTTFFLLFQFFLIDFFLVARISFSFVNISQVLTKWKCGKSAVLSKSKKDKNF